MFMSDVSVVVGGIAGDGINEAGATISRLFNRLGYYVYMYYDYPSRVKGGHNFAIIRASTQKISALSDKVDAVLALNQDTYDFHQSRWKDDTVIIYDHDQVKVSGISQPSVGLPVSQILQEEDGLPVMRNTCVIGGLCKTLGIPWSIIEEVLGKHLPKLLEQNLKVARRGYDAASTQTTFTALDRPGLPVMSGNQAIALGLLHSGLQAFVAYPMTPSSSLLEFLARSAQDFGIQVVHPESEIAVMLMALGFAYMGVKTAVCTSGGGFCLMTEGLSLAGQAELPVVVMMGQRTGPSTGLPTYTAQGDLHFILNAGHGEFPRFVVAPGDADEAYYWSGIALNMAWKYQLPSLILSDKILCEGLYSFDPVLAGDPQEEAPVLWDGRGRYRRYLATETGVSPLTFPPVQGQVIKVNSYTHDEDGITVEDAETTEILVEKRQRKERSLARDLEAYETVKVYGRGNTALVCWGTNKGVCVEIAQKFGLKVIQLLVLAPFPEKRLHEAMQDVERTICVEGNSTGQLSKLLRQNGYQTDDRILKYDGRPFSLEDLETDLRKVIA
jgi:2-oxoglutarate ferredoxin oxidoreductase subunit alpha